MRRQRVRAIGTQPFLKRRGRRDGRCASGEGRIRVDLLVSTAHARKYRIMDNSQLF